MNDRTPSRSTHIVRCEVAGRFFGLDLSAIVGVQPRDVVRFEASNSETVVGTIPSLGRRLPVYSLARLLGVPDANTNSGHCIVTTDGVDVWGLLVDRVSQSESRTASEVVPLPPLVTGSSESVIQGVVCSAGHPDIPLIVLDLKNLRPRSPAANAVDAPLVDSNATHVGRGANPSGAAPRRLITFAPTTAAIDSTTRFAFSVSQVAEITRIPHFVEIPRSPDFIAGLAVWRQAPLPILLLGSSDGGGTNLVDSTARLAIVKVPECDIRMGLLVSSGCEFLTCPLSGTPVSASSIGYSDDLVRAAFRVERQTLLFPRFRITSPA